MTIPNSGVEAPKPFPKILGSLFSFAIVLGALEMISFGTAPLAASAGRLTLAAPSDFSVVESVPTVTFTVVRIEGSDGLVAVDFATCCGSATAGSDYDAAMGTLFWEDGESSVRTVEIALHDDLEVESPTEVFLFQLSNPTGGAVLGASPSGSVGIEDDDIAVHGRFTLQPPSDFSVTEGEQTVTFTVLRIEGSAGLVTVDFATCCGSATAGSDYDAVLGTLAWGDGESGPQSVEIQVHDDSLVESPTEVFLFQMSNPTGGAVFGAAVSGSVGIEDDEFAIHGRLTLAPPSDFSVAEAEQSVAFTVERIEGSAGPVTVDFATCCGTATAGSDYEAVGGTLFWADGDGSSRTVDVLVHDDLLVESPTEVFLFQISNPSGGAVLGAAPSGSVGIEDDEDGGLFIDGFESADACAWSEIVGGRGCAR